VVVVVMEILTPVVQAAQVAEVLIAHHTEQEMQEIHQANLLQEETELRR
jgi:hypothetical protein